MPLLYSCPKCGKLSTTKGRCEEHANRFPPHHMPQGWTKRRNAYLQAHPWCTNPYAAHSQRVKAVTVDHIKPRAEGGTEAEANLQSLCRACAKRKDSADSHRGQARARSNVDMTTRDTQI